MNQNDLISVISLVIGVIGLLIAIYQTYSMQKMKGVLKQKNIERCRVVFLAVTTLAKDAREACQIVDSDCRHQNGKKCSILTAKVNSILTITMQLANFCDTLNQEHKKEFGEFVDEQLNKKIKDLTCLSLSKKFMQNDTD